MEHHDFLNVVQQGWTTPHYITDADKIITTKFKNLRRVLKEWQGNLSNLKKNMANFKLTLSFILFVEEFRDLTLPKWSFKILLEHKLSSLLHQQHIYWKQRGALKWVTLGNASTKFFYANATIKYRRNLITFLEDSTGHIVTTHEDKVEQIWIPFKERLGVSSFSGINFNLLSLLQSGHDLSSLVTPFEKQEIDLVVKNLASNKAPGPDGFNSDFIKKCWHIICNDFYTLCNAFYLGDVCLQSLNGSHIVLIPKHDHVVKV